MKILALDLALATGFAFGEKLETAHCGVWKLPGYSDDRINRTLASIYSAVHATCKANGVDTVIIEAALRTIKKKNKRDVWTKTSSHGDRCLTMLQGAARAGAANAGVKNFEFPAPNTWRASVLSNGYPKNPKSEAIEYVRRNGRNIAEHDAAEALCMLQYGVGKFGLLGRIK